MALAQLRAVDVTDFVQKTVSRLNMRRAKIMTTALRSFLSYARYRGDITSDLAAAVPIVANWALSCIPRAIGRDEVARLLASIDRDTPVGCRDNATILALARLGLRSSEVVSLELDDIDWGAGQIHVRGKNGQHNALPLPADVGEAIADYLRKSRPRNASRRVFLRDKAPIRGFKGPSGLGSAIRRSLERAGIDSPTKGTHQFRHGQGQVRVTRSRVPAGRGAERIAAIGDQWSQAGQSVLRHGRSPAGHWQRAQGTLHPVR